jgi:hypothetical protein
LSSLSRFLKLHAARFARALDQLQAALFVGLMGASEQLLELEAHEPTSLQ